MHPFEPQLGYSEYYLAKKLQGMGHEVCVITSDVFETASNIRCKRSGFFEEEGIKTLRLFTFFKIFDIPFVSLNNFKTYLTKFSPDIVQIQGIMSPLSILAIFYKGIFRYRVVATIISGEATSHGFILALKLAFLRIYLNLLFPWASKNIDGAFVCSEAALAWNRKIFHVPSTKIHFIPFGADSDLFRYNSDERKKIRKILNIDDDDVVAIYTGKMVPHKKVDLLLRASIPLIHNRKDFKLLLVGKGLTEYVNLLKSIVKASNIERNVIFHDAVHRTKLPSFYSASDIAVWPGSCSISIIEAMSMGLPVIIKESKWTNHLLESGNGFSYKEGDIEALRKCISRLIEDGKLRHSMGRKSRRLVEDKLNWDNIAKQYIRIYQSCLESCA